MWQSQRKLLEKYVVILKPLLYFTFFICNQKNLITIEKESPGI